MKLYSAAVAILASVIQPSEGFHTIPSSSSSSSQRRHRIFGGGRRHHTRTPLFVSATEKENSREMSNEIAAGIRLTPTRTTTTTTHRNNGMNVNNKNLDHDISVMDFASVSDQNSIMEKALREARENLLVSTALETSDENSNNSNNGRLMGINDEVVKEVGREIGEFDLLAEDPALLQNAAAYIRSKAPSGLFEPISEMPCVPTNDQNDYTVTNTSPDAVAKYNSLLDATYTESGEVTSAFAKTFYLGTQLLPEAARLAIWAVYVWCRRTDEIVDAPRNLGSDEANNAAMLRDLAEWEDRLEKLWKYGHVVDALDLPLLDVRANYPDLSDQPFVDMIRGMLMDIPQLGVERYHTWDDLHLYCYRVAGTVGLMSMPIFGTNPGITAEDAKEPALSLGVAFQITNILRDVGEDASTRRRVYLPTSHLADFNVTEDQLFAQRMDDNYINLLKYEIELARKYYDKAQEGVYMLSPESRLPTQVSLDCYRKILNKIEDNGYDTLNTRAYVSKWEKIWTIPFSWYRTQEAWNKAFPLPDDW